MNLKRGSHFLHRFWLDPSKMPGHAPILCRVTRIAGGSVYYRPVYEPHDDGSEHLGSAMHFPLTNAGAYVGPLVDYPTRPALPTPTQEASK